MSDRLSEIAERDRQCAAAEAAGSILSQAQQDRVFLGMTIAAAITYIRSVRDGNGWKEIPVGVLNQIEAILLGKDGGDAGT